MRLRLRAFQMCRSFQRRSKRILSLLVSIFTVFSLLSGAASAASQTLTILGASGSAGQTDTYTSFSMDGGATWQPAYLMGWHPWGFVPGTNSWLNCAPTGGAPACLNRSVLYRVRFNVPDGASNPQMVFDVKADNAATIWVNGTYVTYIEGQGGTTADTTIASSIQTGLNEIRIKVDDWGGLAGFNYKVTLTMDAPTPLTTAPAIAVPEITASGAAATFSTSPVPVDPGVTLQNFDSITGATVTINGGFVASQDLLAMPAQNGISASYNAATGVLTLTGAASQAAYQQALRSVTYQNTSTNPQPQPRTVTFTIGSGALYLSATQHFYEFVAAPGITWTSARDAAQQRTLYGLRGYMATITSATENQFITSKLTGAGWIGASDSAQEGIWRWVAGPEAGTQFSGQYKTGWCSAYTAPGVNGQYAHWWSGEPNDCGGSGAGSHAEDYAHMYSNGYWNDYPNNAGGNIVGYVTEYGGMSGDPAPTLSANVTVNISVDTTPPVTTVTAPAAWQNQDVTLTLVAVDDRSGVAATYYKLDGGAQQSGNSVTLTTDGVHTLEFWSVDNAGNTEASHTVTVSVDKTAPTITGAADRAANANGWYDADVTVTFTCADATSGIAACTAPVVIGEGASQAATGTAADNAGNTASTTVSGVNVDKTAPTISGSTDRAANANGWYNADVTVTFTCADATSGIAACTAPVVIGEGASQAATGTAADNAGNTASTTVSGVNVDKTAPTISGSTDRAANANGWYNASVTVTFTCGDALAGVAACTGPVTLAGEGAGQSATGTAVDNAGNTAATTVSPINIDLTAPVVTYTGNAGTYTVDQMVSITCAAADSLSGVASNTCANVTGPAYSFLLGDNAYSASATDNAGNTGTATASFTVSVTYASLCNLTKQFVTKDGVANSLCAKLDAAAKQAAAGNTGASNNILQAYMNEVAAQSGKSMTGAQAEILTRLARSLVR